MDEDELKAAIIKAREDEQALHVGGALPAFADVAPLTSAPAALGCG